MTHLLSPLAASVIFVFSLLCLRRVSLPLPSGSRPVSSLTVIFITNATAGLVFSLYWLRGGPPLAWELMWQPFLTAATFVAGLALTVLAVEYGEVSVATPLLGTKVLWVGLFITLAGLQPFSWMLLGSTVLAATGIALIQATGGTGPANVPRTIGVALTAAVSYAACDLLFQRYASVWGAGRFIPITYWMVAAISLCLLPWVDWPAVRAPDRRWWLTAGIALMLIQITLLDITLSTFGDAARVNVVYATRGLWGVLIGWVWTRTIGASIQLTPTAEYRKRFCGAILLTASVIMMLR